MARTSGWRPTRRQWPLTLAGLVAAGNLVAVSALPDSARRSYGGVLFGVGIGALIVVTIYARAIGSGAPETHAVVLLGGPCDGRLLLSPSSTVPTEAWLADPDGTVCVYSLDTNRRSTPAVLRYQRPVLPRPTPIP